MQVESILIDRRNIESELPKLLKELQEGSLIGFDIETFDTPLPAFAAYQKSIRPKLVFDHRRTTVTGFSLYADGSDKAYYINLNHADIENRVEWQEVKVLLDTIVGKSDKIVVCHNSPFEITMMSSSLGYELHGNIVCTMQMAVTAYGPDEYDPIKFQSQKLKSMSGLMNEIKLNFSPKQGEKFNMYELNEKQRTLVGKVVSKSSTARESYNGLVDNISYGYGLKKIVQSAFGQKIPSFNDTLNGKKHMGELTGEETSDYGAADSYWAVEVYKWLMDYMLNTNPLVIQTFFEQENPMIYKYADIWKEGMKVNFPNIEKRRDKEREDAAQVFRDLKVALAKHLPFNKDPQPLLMKENRVYKSKTAGKGYQGYRRAIEKFVNTPDTDDDYEQCQQVRSSVSNAWAQDEGKPESTGVNMTYYCTQQTIIYDLLKIKPRRVKGTISSNSDIRELLLVEYKDKPEYEVISLIDKLAKIEQRMKLYLTPYMGLTDPDTERMYPVVSSKLATRRLAASFPNAMQLSKRGESTYIRGFYQPDNEDHLIISLDWSQVELVLIGEFSKDPEFFKCYSSVPYDDLHEIAAAALMGLTEEQFKELKVEDKAKYKESRTDFGKGSNFNYWYSGALWTVGEKLKLSKEEILDKGEKYRTRFAVAEKWRLDLIDEARRNGFITLPDHTRRVKFEATSEWASLMRRWFATHSGLKNFGDIVIRKTQTRANNQIVNAMIQGTCATLAKRSALRIVEKCKEEGIEARFMIPIHDELVWSVKSTDVVRFLQIARECMTNHPEIVSSLVLDCTASIGNTFEPYNKAHVPYGQIELDELPSEFCITSDYEGRATEQETLAVVDYLMKGK